MGLSVFYIYPSLAAKPYYYNPASCVGVYPNQICSNIDKTFTTPQGVQKTHVTPKKTFTTPQGMQKTHVVSGGPVNNPNKMSHGKSGK